MDLYALLKTNYQTGISPFALYSRMCDGCKGDLALLERVRRLYDLHTQGDIFGEIKRLEKDEWTAYRNRFDKGEQYCLLVVACLLHNEWGLNVEEKSKSVAKAGVKRAKRESGEQLALPLGTPIAANPRRTPLKPAPIQPSPKPVIAKPVQKPIPKVRATGKIGNAKPLIFVPTVSVKRIQVCNWSGELTVRTGNQSDQFEVYVHNPFKSNPPTGDIAVINDCAYVNLHSLGADEIRVMIPKGKYDGIEIDKGAGKLQFFDTGDCFKEVQIISGAGRIRCDTSAPKLTISGRAGEIYVKYFTSREGSVNVRNLFGDVWIDLKQMYTTNLDLVSESGRVENRHVGGVNAEVDVKVRTRYGDILLT